MKQPELKPDLPEINKLKQNIFGSQGRPLVNEPKLAVGETKQAAAVCCCWSLI